MENSSGIVDADSIVCFGVQAVSLDEEDLAREFSGAVRLTVHVQEEVTLTPEQARPALVALLSSWNLLLCLGQVVARLAGICGVKQRCRKK